MKKLFIMAVAAMAMLASCSSDSEEPVKEEPLSPYIDKTYWLDMRSSDKVNWGFGVFRLLYLYSDGKFLYYIDTVTNSSGAYDVEETGTYTKRGNNITFSPSGVDDEIRSAEISGDTIIVAGQGAKGKWYLKGPEKNW